MVVKDSLHIITFHKSKYTNCINYYANVIIYLNIKNSIVDSENNIDDCDPNPCINNGTCTDGVDSFTCNCVNGFTGVNCTTNIDDCNPNPCMNNGICTDGVNYYTCNCVEGFTGENCTSNIDDCDPNPCMNNGKCTDRINSITCFFQWLY